jgi:hypothetical protein
MRGSKSEGEIEKGDVITVSIQKRPEIQADKHLDGTPSIFEKIREALNPDHISLHAILAKP